jgi:hypothetical protein
LKEIHRLELEKSLKSPDARLWILLLCELYFRSIVVTTSALVSFRQFSRTATHSINQPHVFLFRRGILSNVFFLCCAFTLVPCTVEYGVVQHCAHPGQTLHYDMLFILSNEHKHSKHGPTLRICTVGTCTFSACRTVTFILFWTTHACTVLLMASVL